MNVLTTSSYYVNAVQDAEIDEDKPYNSDSHYLVPYLRKSKYRDPVYTERKVLHPRRRTSGTARKGDKKIEAHLEANQETYPGECLSLIGQQKLKVAPHQIITAVMSNEGNSSSFGSLSNAITLSTVAELRSSSLSLRACRWLEMRPKQTRHSVPKANLELKILCKCWDLAEYTIKTFVDPQHRSWTQLRSRICPSCFSGVLDYVWAPTEPPRYK